ncbi:Hsp33 family molecular chaperone HslO [Phragmitibacter flavus]|uniref:Hsp33 family molecular chaperone HslO n=1 Tax=Phragmitibacter flavus TaxID=2576071 RepID=A0A5R8KGC4_9BACT|nr:Hsp33 family molecular chaperone HslO [Phragmitibacter flavus]TLD71005.1 Hsp33 family molecular chaperone HslO [Phragmitibacter flavus]
MADAEPESEPEPGILDVRTYFVRGRNALLARADFEPLYIDYYLHLADHGLRYAPQADLMLKEALAALTLHLASRPQDEGAGWTMNFNEPHMNLFVTGCTRPPHVTGRVFTEDVRAFEKSLIIAQRIRNGQNTGQSMVEFTGSDIFAAVEQFYEQSEQRLARLFRYDHEDLVMVTAQPDCDEDWLRSLTEEDIRTIDQKETLSLLEERQYVWKCGCSIERLYPLLARLGDNDLNDAFGGDEIITLTCPRCGARYRASKEQFEAWQATH